MPVYVYRNLVTNETFEYEQRITEDALTKDPRTGDPVRRVIQPVGIAFKGSGFYVNDSRAGASGAKASKGGSTGDGAASDKAAGASEGSAAAATGSSEKSGTASAAGVASAG